MALVEKILRELKQTVPTLKLVVDEKLRDAEFIEGYLLTENNDAKIYRRPKSAKSGCYCIIKDDVYIETRPGRNFGGLHSPWQSYGALKDYLQKMKLVLGRKQELNGIIVENQVTKGIIIKIATGLNIGLKDAMGVYIYKPELKLPELIICVDKEADKVFARIIKALGTPLGYDLQLPKPVVERYKTNSLVAVLSKNKGIEIEPSRKGTGFDYFYWRGNDVSEDSDKNGTGSIEKFVVTNHEDAGYIALEYLERRKTVQITELVEE